TSKTHVDGFFQNTVAAAERFRVDHEILDAGGIRKRFPQFRVANDEVGYFEPSAGFVRPEACVSAQLELARVRGAGIRMNDRVLGFDEARTSVVVATADMTYRAEQLIVCAGPWLPWLLDDRLRDVFCVYRQVLLWFEVKGSVVPWLVDRFPI